MKHKSPLDIEYKLNKHYYELNEDTQRMLDMIMTVLNTAHGLEMYHNRTGKEILIKFSPDNPLALTDDYVSWGQAIHALLTDVVLERDLPTQAYKAGKKH